MLVSTTLGLEFWQMFHTVLLIQILQHHLEGHAMVIYCQMFSQYKTIKESAVSGADPEFFIGGGMIIKLHVICV